MAITTALSSFLAKCVRVWHILRKPDSKDFKLIAKVSALGILVIGLIGFVISVVMNFVK